MNKYEVGQIWSYKTRAHESDSKVTILKVESYDKLGTVIHIYVSGVAIENPNDPDNPHDDISHMPFSEQAINESVTELVGKTDVPDCSEGYGIWKEAFENGEAGVFSIQVSESVSFMEDTLNSGTTEYDS